MMFLGIEIGGTKLQMGVGADDGVLCGLWRGLVDVAAGPAGIRRQIAAALPELLDRANIQRGRLQAAGVGFGGPIDDATRTIIKSHQIAGWDGFPLADWIADLLGLPTALGNDADVAGLAEALHGAGRGLSPVFYITIGSGIGGGLILDGEIFRGVGKGAAEIGHLRFGASPETVEDCSSGWGIERTARAQAAAQPDAYRTILAAAGSPEAVTVRHLADAARAGDPQARLVLDRACTVLAQAIAQVIALLCPRRIVIGGGVSLIGDDLLFDPLRRLVDDRVFKPFAGLTDIVPAALGEEVVVHGALALARKLVTARSAAPSPPQPPSRPSSAAP